MKCKNYYCPPLLIINKYSCAEYSGYINLLSQSSFHEWIAQRKLKLTDIGLFAVPGIPSYSIQIHFHIHNEMNEGESVRVVPEEGKVKVEAEEGRNGYSRIL